MIHAPFRAGPTDAPITLIGQAPGKDEAAHGGAFIGAAGKALTRFCASAGLNKETCYLDNLFQFFPDHDDLTPYIKLGSKLAKETPIFQTHREALRQRLLRTSSNVIVSLGAISTYALTGKVGAVGKWHGSVLESTLVPGRKVIPTFHPASTLKGEYLNGYHIVLDLARAKKESAYPEIRRLQRNLLMNTNFAEATSYLEHCRQQHLVAYDIETRGLHLSHISFATSATNALCLPLVDGAKDVWAPEEEASLLRHVVELLEDPRVTKLGHNLAFDCTFMLRRYGAYVHPVEDTMIAAAILAPDFPKFLYSLVSTYCDGEPYYKDDGKNWRFAEMRDEQVFRRYNAMDSAVLHQIWPTQKAELLRARNWEAYEDQRDLLYPLVYAGDRGLPVDTEGMKKAAGACGERITAVEEQLRALMGDDINFDSNNQLLRYFYMTKGLKPYVKRRKRGESTPTIDEMALTRIASYGHEEARLLLERREIVRAKGTYFEMGVDEDKRVRCSFNPVGTVQARISSSKTIWGTGANLQNQTSEMLALFKADAGGIYICFDLAQAENRYVAYEAQERKMIEALEAGVDIHALTGSLIHNVPIEKVSKEIRDDGKIGNHSLNYGIGEETFILRNRLQRERGRLIYRQYFMVYPSIAEWHSRIQQELIDNRRVLVNVYGRARRFFDAWGADLFEKAYNYKPQSSIATKMNRDGVKFSYYRQDLFPLVEFANTVHDSLWLWAPLAMGPPALVRTALEIKRQLETPLALYGRTFSIPADVKIGFSLNEHTMLEWKASKTDFSRVDKLEGELAEYVEKTARGLD